MFICFQYASLYQVLELTVKYVQMVKERMPPSVLQEVCFISASKDFSLCDVIEVKHRALH